MDPRRWGSAHKRPRVRKTFGSQDEGDQPLTEWSGAVSDLWESPNFAAIENAIDEAHWILDLQDNFDGEGSAGYRPDTLSRAFRYLRQVAEAGYGAHRIVIDAPQVNPADHGSIDLFWRFDGGELLVNVPAGDEQLLTYYGRNADGETIGGTVSGNRPHLELATWLIRNR